MIVVCVFISVDACLKYMCIVLSVCSVGLHSTVIATQLEVFVNFVTIFYEIFVLRIDWINIHVCDWNK